MDEPEEDPVVVAVVLTRSPEAVEAVRAGFARSGFTAGPGVGPTFSIEAPASRFAESLGAAPVLAPDGGWTTAEGDELPLGRLPRGLREELVAVALERPMDLHGEGPGGGAG